MSAVMSAFGPKRTCAFALHMSAFGGKADMTVCGCLLSRSLLGVKRTLPFAAHMSAIDPKRTCHRSNKLRINNIVVERDWLVFRPSQYPQSLENSAPSTTTIARKLRFDRIERGREPIVG